MAEAQQRDTAVDLRGVWGQTIRREVVSANVAELVSGTLLLTAIYLPAGVPVGFISWRSGTTALGVGLNQWAALYEMEFNALNKLAVSADQTTGAWAANTNKVFTISSPYTITQSGLYYVGLCVVATTVPSLACGPTMHTGISGLEGRVRSGRSTTGLTTPALAPDPAAEPTARDNVPLAWVA